MMAALAEAAKPPVSRPPPMKLNPVRTPIPEGDPEERIQDFGEILHGYSLEEAVLEAKRCIQCGRPYCVEACPITQDAREYIRLIADRKLDESAKVVVKENPLATTLCNVCYRYCEDACIVGKRGVPIAIRHLKRAAMEYGSSQLTYVPSAPKNQRIAIIGGGPAGLMAAWELGIRGYSITLFEQAETLGGQAMTIPKYRMEKADLDDDMARFRQLNVTFVTGKRAGVDFKPEDLLKEGYEAVYIAIGTTSHRSIGISGEDLPGVFHAIDMLFEINKGQNVEVGKKIVVVGGGDVAMDASRSALRLSHGGEVTIIYRRSIDEMPADKEEVHEAREEGIRFQILTAPLRIVGKERVEGIVVQKMELGPPDPSGRRSPLPVPGSEETIPCDTVIVAVGQKTDLTGFPKELDLKAGSQGWPEGKGEGMATGVEGIFASGGRSVVYAMAAGTHAAVAIDAYLSKKKGEAPGPRPDPFGGSDPPKLPKGYTKPLWH